MRCFSRLHSFTQCFLEGFINQKDQKKLLVREKRVAQLVGGDNVHTFISANQSSKRFPVWISHDEHYRSTFLVAIVHREIKSIFGGQIQSYDKVLTYGRAEVMQRLREQALGEAGAKLST